MWKAGQTPERSESWRLVLGRLQQLLLPTLPVTFRFYFSAWRSRAADLPERQRPGGCGYTSALRWRQRRSTRVEKSHQERGWMQSAGRTFLGVRPADHHTATGWTYKTVAGGSLVFFFIEKSKFGEEKKKVPILCVYLYVQGRRRQQTSSQTHEFCSVEWIGRFWGWEKKRTS